MGCRKSRAIFVYRWNPGDWARLISDSPLFVVVCRDAPNIPLAVGEFTRFVSDETDISPYISEPDGIGDREAALKLSERP